MALLRLWVSSTTPFYTRITCLVRLLAVSYYI